MKQRWAPPFQRRTSRTVIAVSYTHLDVYKRQILDHQHTDFLELLAQLLDVIADNAVIDVHIALVVEHIAVSYTHLDVYKRQAEMIAGTRGAIIFRIITDQGSSSMRCVCTCYYTWTSTRIRIAKPFPFLSH